MGLSDLSNGSLRNVNFNNFKSIIFRYVDYVKLHFNEIYINKSILKRKLKKNLKEIGIFIIKLFYNNIYANLN